MELMDAVSAFDGAVSGLSKLTSLVRNVRGDERNSEIAEAVEAVKDELNGARAQVTALIRENLSMQQKIATLSELNTKLNQEAERQKRFAVEAEKYELRTVAANTVLYALRNPSEEGAPAHHLCTRCFDEKIRSIVQFKSRNARVDKVYCPICNAEYAIENNLRHRPAGKVGEGPKGRRSNHWMAS